MAHHGKETPQVHAENSTHNPTSANTGTPRHFGRQILQSVLIWLAIVPCAILNGILREEVLRPIAGESVALFVSGLLLMGMILLLSWLFLPRLDKPGHPLPAWRIGGLWMVLTIAFECGMGLSQGADINEILRNYDMSGGNLWPLIVLFTGCAPRLVLWLRQ